ncbi:MAG: hypothetical protein ACK559_28535, partial [bacterium]
RSFMKSTAPRNGHCSKRTRWFSVRQARPSSGYLQLAPRLCPDVPCSLIGEVSEPEAAKRGRVTVDVEDRQIVRQLGIIDPLEVELHGLASE